MTEPMHVQEVYLRPLMPDPQAALIDRLTDDEVIKLVRGGK